LECWFTVTGALKAWNEGTAPGPLVSYRAHRVVLLRQQKFGSYGRRSGLSVHQLHVYEFIQT
jgi:hypothetical protein